MKTFKLINRYGQHISNINIAYVLDKNILLELAKYGYHVEY